MQSFRKRNGLFRNCFETVAHQFQTACYDKHSSKREHEKSRQTTLGGHDHGYGKSEQRRQEILEDLIKIRSNKHFDLVFIPSPHDIHQDHTTIAQEGIRAFKNTTILGYELIWNNLTFNTECFIQLEKKHIERKVLALKEYRSQGQRNYLSDEFVFSLAKARGVQIGCEYAEAFEVIRLFL